MAPFGTSCFELPWATLPVQHALGYPFVVISGVQASIPLLLISQGCPASRVAPCSSLEQPRGMPLFRNCCAAVSGQDPCLTIGHVTIPAPALNSPSASHFSGNCRRNQVGKTLVMRHHPGAMPIGLKPPKLNCAVVSFQVYGWCEPTIPAMTA